MLVTMAGGGSKPLSEVKPGEQVMTVDPASHRERAVTVKELTVHAVKNYAITRLVLIKAVERGERDIVLSSRLLEATPNHPMADGRTVGELKVGDKVWCLDGRGYQVFTVWDRNETAGGMQRVYNIVAGGGSTLIMNGVMVMQKPAKGPATGSSGTH